MKFPPTSAPGDYNHPPGGSHTFTAKKPSYNTFEYNNKKVDNTLLKKHTPLCDIKKDRRNKFSALLQNFCNKKQGNYFVFIP